ncbi:MAG: class II aldolase [Clostridia bacterium]|nr:class II aldolase [Clostridia bacterium]
MGLEIIEKISHKYGSNPAYVLAGGGNTSYKNEEYLYIKGSGTSLATITKDGFVKMSREALANIWSKSYSREQDKREAEVLADMMASKCEGEESKRPSVETLLHNLFVQPYVLHVHPTMVNGLTCSQDGKNGMENMFPNAIWVEETEPGYTLACKCRERIADYERLTGKNANLLFLQNHGVFFAAYDEKEMDELVSNVIAEFEKRISTYPDMTAIKADQDKVNKAIDVLKTICDDGSVINFTLNREVKRLCSTYESFEILVNPMTPDHIVYCKAVPLFVDSVEQVKEKYAEFKTEKCYAPKIIFVKNLGMFAIGNSEKNASVVSDVWLDAVKISVYAQSFGGVRHMAPDMVDFIANWEVENYRSKVELK